MLVTSAHSAITTITVATLMPALLPSPGTLNLLVLSFAPATGAAKAVAVTTVAVRSDMDGFPVVDDGQHFLAQADELAFGLDLAGVAVVEELA